MYKINDYIIYKREVCKVINVLPKYFKNQDYYLLSPLSDSSLTIKVPIDNDSIRNIITKKEVKKIITEIPNISPVNTNDKNLENIYKELLTSNTHENLIKIIKTTYLRNKERIDNNKKTTDKDTYYFNLAEKYLYERWRQYIDIRPNIEPEPKRIELVEG